MKSPRVPAIALAVALLALVLGLAACGKKSEDTSTEAQPISLTLDFYPNPDHAGIYMAQKLGYFEEAGLDVSIASPSDPAAPLKLVAAGRSDLAISYEPEVVLAHEEGLGVVAIAALVNRPLTSMIWLKKSGIKGVGDLKGKTIATAGIPYQEAFLKTILGRAKLTPADVKAVNVGFGLLPALVSGSAQAMLGGYSNVEGVDLRERGKQPVVTPVDKLGVPTYDELVVVAKRESLDTAGASRLRRFLIATAAGYRLLKTEPAAGVDALAQASHGIDKGLQAASIQATLPVFFPRDAAHPWGWQDLTAWARYERWMRANHLLKRPPSESPPLTNEFLAGQGA
jgi:putative hydroxymethylpyrimidine transport system substrate-binding protein